MSEWIRANERLPGAKEAGRYATWQESENVLVFCESRRMTVAQCIIGEQGYFWGGYDMPAEIVTHWMPLPEPPKDAEMEKA